MNSFIILLFCYFGSLFTIYNGNGSDIYNPRYYKMGMMVIEKALERLLYPSRIDFPLKILFLIFGFPIQISPLRLQIRDIYDSTTDILTTNSMIDQISQSMRSM